MIKDYFKMAVSNLTHQGLRSWLTMIGIFIGIAAVVALISLGQGLEAAIENQFYEIGTDVVIIQPRGSGFVTSGDDNPAQLTEGDEDTVSKTNGVIETGSLVIRSGRIEFKDEVNYQFITGLPVDDPEKRRLMQRVSTMDIVQGRNLEGGDKYKALAGHSYTVRDDVFSETLRPGDKVTVDGQVFDIVGILEKIGSPPDDKQLVIPLETADDFLDLAEVNGDKARDMIVAQVNPNADPEEMAERIERELRNYRDVDEGDEDFQVQTAEQLLSSFNTILGVVQFVLIGIAAISLLVGGIGIMNTMYTAVLERTKEIGIMKAIGARNGDVLLIFLVESGVLGVVGGAIGVVLGFGISSLVTVVVQTMLGPDYMVTFFPWWLIVGALSFSFIVGAVSGVFPAMQAARMDPVDALRYE